MNECEWCGGTVRIQLSHGEWLCMNCRAEIAWLAISSTLEGVTE